MKAIGWLYDNEFKYVFQNIGKDLWEDLRQEVAVIVLEYDADKLRELEAKGKQVFKFWIVRICCNQTNSKYGKFGRMYAALVPSSHLLCPDWSCLSYTAIHPHTSNHLRCRFSLG